MTLKMMCAQKHDDVVTVTNEAPESGIFLEVILDTDGGPGEETSSMVELTPYAANRLGEELIRLAYEEGYLDG